MMRSNDSKITYDVIVIGGGASGMMAAGTAGARGRKVLLLEKNKRLGEKLRITGGGRCNITNYELDIRMLLKKYGAAESFLYSSFSEFGVLDTERFFKERGLSLVIEDRKRAFPHTMKSSDVESVMESFCKENHVTILTNSPVSEIIIEGGVIQGVMTNNTFYVASSYIIATGGMSHPETGSTGDAMKWLTDLGHTLAQPTPSLVPIMIHESWPQKISGTTLTEVKIYFFVDGKKKFTQSGNILCTHFGFSGPMILNSAKKIGDLLHEGEVTGYIDIFPTKDLGALDQEIVQLFNKYKNKTFKNICKQVVPAGVTPAILEILGVVFADKKVHSITKDERKQLVHFLKKMPITVNGLLGHDKAIVADGGIVLEEMNMKTMQSRKYPELFITGDMLHINRPSGGFSLQLCWTSGYVAGMNA